MGFIQLSCDFIYKFLKLLFRLYFSDVIVHSAGWIYIQNVDVPKA
jgi:hypothetical protein